MDGIMIEIIFDDVQDAYLMWLYYITAFLIIASDFQKSTYLFCWVRILIQYYHALC